MNTCLLMAFNHVVLKSPVRPGLTTEREKLYLGIKAHRKAMKRKRLFLRTFHILTCSYMAGTLVHGSPYAGAIGNMMHHDKLKTLKGQLGEEGFTEALFSIKGEKVFANIDMNWNEALMAYRETGKSSKNRYGGYSMKEMHLIDEAFNSNDDRDTFFGLNAAINVLYCIHASKTKSLLRARSPRPKRK